ncbi:hypothetical protein JNM87_04700 [Candidatus Saccharibacteria bacterium]|nr:hypothetical protein [Candidatus Saccharibacteria bacterium]
MSQEKGRGLSSLNNEGTSVPEPVRSAGGERSEPGEGGLQSSAAMIAPEKGRAPSNQMIELQQTDT